MNCRTWLLLALSFVTPASAEVRVYIEDVAGTAWVRYDCTAGEVVRAFALDVTVDRGRIVGVSNFIRGESKPGANGYGIFPASFRDHIVVGSGTNVDWQVSGYSPVAVFADNPAETLPGLNSSGVTLEFGALWDSRKEGAAPGPFGTLCALRLSEPARVSIAANRFRGGVVSAFLGPLDTQFTGSLVGPGITRAEVVDGAMFIEFKGGTLETAEELEGVWIDTGNDSGEFSEVIGSGLSKFYRVRAAIP